jgi:hypothetical protein
LTSCNKEAVLSASSDAPSPASSTLPAQIASPKLTLLQNYWLSSEALVNHTDAYSWVKLITLPIFIISVISGGWITSKTSDKYLLLLSEGVLLTFSGLAALDIGSLYRSKFHDASIRLSLRKNLATVGGFLAGCLLGVILAKQIGLCATILPGILLVLYYVSRMI